MNVDALSLSLYLAQIPPFPLLLKPSDDACIVVSFGLVSPVREASPTCDGQGTH